MRCRVQYQEILVTQDIIARLALPRFYTEGDQSEISAVVHNYTDQTQSVQLTLTMSNQFKTNLPVAQNLSVEPEKAARFSWPVTVAHPGKGVIRLKAKGQTGGDYLERTLPVNALGIPFVSSDSGVLTDAIPSVTISHAELGQVFSPTMTVDLAGSTIGEVQGTFDSLIDYPYGCTEQTMSRFMPSIVAMQLNKKLDVPLLPSSIKRFEKVREIGMAKLIEHHHSDGGWGWWKDDASDPYMTSLVLEGLHLYKDADAKYTVDPDLTASGLKWLSDYSVRLEKQLSDPKLVNDYMAETRRCDMARLAYTLTVYKKPPAKTVVKWLKNEIPRFTPEPLAYTAMTLKSIGDEEGSQKALQRLLAIANKTESTVDWEHTDAMMKRLKLLDVTDYTYRYTGEETTALALRAVIDVAPDKVELIESIKSWLLLHRDGKNWSNTKTTSEVLHALLQDAVLTASTSGDTVTAKILMNNILTNESTFTGADLYSQERSFKLPSFIPKTGSVRIEKEGKGRMYYHTWLAYTKVLKPGEPVPVKNIPAGLSMTRSFFRLKSTPAGADGVIHVKTEPLSGEIKAGETLLMKVSVDCPMSLPYVSVECPLPSGAEVVQSRGAEVAAGEDSANEGIYGEWGNSWWSHQDVLDDKIVFFGTSIPQGKKEFFTLLRMELPGKVQLNPVTLEGMYTKLIRGYTQSEELTIK
ncbi:MAG: hypothetical protein K2X93_09000 [Candidatus Obscuribacterales bacterium]|nr:hypothetical protein [Candidatus Obscuribacterales bacterium]